LKILALCDRRCATRAFETQPERLQSRSLNPLNVTQKRMKVLRTLAIPSLDIPETEPMLIAQTKQAPVLH
jgi:hypothetical protein